MLEFNWLVSSWCKNQSWAQHHLHHGAAAVAARTLNPSRQRPVLQGLLEMTKKHQLSNGMRFEMIWDDLGVLCPSIFRVGKHVVLRDHLFPSSEHGPGDAHNVVSSDAIDVWLNGKNEKCWMLSLDVCRHVSSPENGQRQELLWLARSSGLACLPTCFANTAGSHLCTTSPEICQGMQNIQQNRHRCPHENDHSRDMKIHIPWGGKLPP